MLSTIKTLILVGLILVVLKVQSLPGLEEAFSQHSIRRSPNAVKQFSSQQAFEKPPSPVRLSTDSEDSSRGGAVSREVLRQQRKKVFMDMQERLPLPESAEKHANGLRVVTFNVGKFKDLEGKNSLSSIVDSIHQSNADIIALQEVKTKRLQELEDQLNAKGKEYEAVKCNYLGGRSMVLLISKVLSVSKSGSSFGLDRCIPYATVQHPASSKPLDIANVHLSHASPLLRSAQLEIANSKVGRGGRDALIVGDFNIPDREHVENLANVKGKVPLLGGDGIGSLGDAFTHWKGINVDHAIANPELAERLLKVGAMQQTGSDHTMLHMDFLLSPQAQQTSESN